MKSCVDSIAIQAVESALISGLGDILTPSLVMQMEQAAVTRIANESQESQSQRLELSRTLAILRAGVVTCKRYVTRSPPGRLIQGGDNGP